MRHRSQARPLIWYALLVLLAFIACYALFRGFYEVGYAYGQPGSGSGSDSGSVTAVQPPVPVVPVVPTIQEQLEAALKSLNMYREQTDASAKRLGLFALITAAAQLLIAVLKRFTGVGGERGKRWIPMIALGLGVVVGATSMLAAGQTAAVALLYGAGPPLSVFVHELLNLIKPKPATT